MIRIIVKKSFCSIPEGYDEELVSLRVEIMDGLTRQTELFWDGGLMNGDALRWRVGIDTRHSWMHTEWCFGRM